MGKSSKTEDRDAAIVKYQQQTQEAMHKMTQDMDRAAKYAISNNTKAGKQNIEDFGQLQNNIKNADIYGKAFEQGSKMAEAAAASQGAQAQTAARNAGMSKAAAAEMGANARQQSFNNALQNQQNVATNTMQNQLGQYANALGNKARSRESLASRNAAAAMQGAGAANQHQMYGADAQGKTAGLYQGAAGQDYDQTWGTAGAFLSSDENLKTFYPDENQENEDKWAKVDAILAKHMENK